MNRGCRRTVVGCWNWRDSTHGSKGSYALSVTFDAALGPSVQAATRVSAPGETGKEYVVKVHCDEGVASPLIRAQAPVRTSAKRRWGASRPAIEPRNRYNSECHVVYSTEGKIGRRDIAECPPNSAWSESLACTDAPCAGTGRSLDRP